MKSRDYHNEIDGYAAQWTRNLMKKGLIPDGFVDERDIRDVQPMDLWGFTRCHFFSGIAGWALRAAARRRSRRLPAVDRELSMPAFQRGRQTGVC